MALANPVWDYSEAAPRSSRSAPGLFATLAAGTAFTVCVAVGLSVVLAGAGGLFHVADTTAPAPYAPPARHIAPPPAPVAPAISPLARSAERFLAESLPLTRVCSLDCAPLAAELAVARAAGSFGTPGLARGPAGLPMQQSFHPARPEPITPAPAAAIVPATPPAAPPTPPAPIRIAPAVVVPLPPVAPAPAAPMPAGRLGRPATERIAATDPQQKSAPPAPAPTRIAPPMAPTVIGRHDGIAVYDIAAATVYMPDGERLEAHSGVGYMADNPSYVDRRNIGPTPPNTYNLVMRKGRFHGVEALRLLPANGDNRFGRVGLLAHTYLLRNRPAQSNGCVAFKDYGRFLAAFKRGEIRQMIVVPSLASTHLRIASAGA